MGAIDGKYGGDSMRAPDRNKALGALADLVKSLNSNASEPLGYPNPPARMILEMLGVPDVAKTLDRLSYGDSLTTGSGMTTRPRDEVLNAAMAVAPFVAAAPGAINKGASAIGKAVEPSVARMVNSAMDRGGLPAEMLQAMASKTISPATVWHGSPHKFDKFDASKIGTGEGAQAYGNGLYLAESPAVAKEYAGALSAAKATKPVGNVDLTQAYQNLENDVPDSLLAARRDFRSLNDMGELLPADRRDFLSAVNNNINASRGGALYKVDLPDEHIAKMLNWDKPLNQQHPDVQKILNDKYHWDASQSTEAVSDLLKGLNKNLFQNGNGAPDRATRYLGENGIPGIRYLDAMSREGGGTSNYVIFPGNEGLLNILERNGAPIPSTIQKQAIEKFVYPQRESLVNIASEPFTSPTPKHVADAPAPIEYSGNTYHESNDARQKKLADLFGAFGSPSQSIHQFMSPQKARLLHEKGLLNASKKELNLLLDMTDSNGVIRPQLEKPMEYAKGGIVTRQMTGDGRNIAHFATGGSVTAGPWWDSYQSGTPDEQPTASTPTLTLEDFRARISPNMLDAEGRFKAPAAGVNYMLEGLTPEQAYSSAQAQTSPETDGSAGRDAYQNTARAQMLDPSWRTGPNNGGGFLGGLGAAAQGMFDGVRTNPAIMAALTAGVGSSLNPAISEGLQSAGMSANAAKTAAPMVLNAGKTVLSGGSLADAAKGAAVGYAGGEIGGAVKDTTGSDFMGNAARTLTQTALNGGSLSIDELAAQYASGKLTDLSGLPSQVASIVVSLARNRKTTPGAMVGALSQVARKAS